VSEGRVNGVDSSDWIWITACPVRSDLASAFSFLGYVFLFTTAALEGPTGEGGEPARRRNCYAISGRPPSFFDFVLVKRSISVIKRLKNLDSISLDIVEGILK